MYTHFDGHAQARAQEARQGFGESVGMPARRPPSSPPHVAFQLISARMPPLMRA